jgi:GGDEF domain-containing protein
MITAMDRMARIPTTAVLQRLMPALIDSVTGGLRQGDIVWRYSPSQLILLLPMTTYEDCIAVMGRLLKKFRTVTQMPTVDLRMTICPMEPVGEAGK